MGEVDFGFLAVPAGRAGRARRASCTPGCSTGARFHRDLGYRTAWLIEHHFSDYYPCPSPVVSMAHIAPRFPTSPSAPACWSRPWHDPLRLAGELAMLTNMTDAEALHRARPRHREVRVRRVRRRDGEARERFREAWEVLDRAMTRRAVHLRRHHLHVDTPVRVRPTPVRERIDFFGAIGSSSSTAVMAELGLAPMCTRFGVQTVELLPAWEERAAEVGTLARRRAAAAAAREHRRRRDRRGGDRRGADLHDALHAGPDRPLRRVPRSTWRT